MKKNIIAVFDTDGEYACNFAEYLNSRKKVPFEVEAFTDKNKFQTYIDKHPPEILLIAKQGADLQMNEKELEHVILLSEEPQHEEDGCKYVYKYQSAETVIQEVMAYYVENTSLTMHAFDKKKMDMIGVYSPTGSGQKTLLSLTIGQILGEKRSVLYLNMEDFSGFDSLFSFVKEENLTEFFYTLRCKETLQPGELRSCIQTIGNMDMIPPVNSVEDLRTITFPEWMKLFELIQEEMNYDTILLDFGNGVDQIFKILSLCKYIYVPIEEDKMAIFKWKQFCKLIDQWGGIAAEKIRELKLPICNIDLEDPDFLKILTWGKWGDFVRKVLEHDGL